MKFEVDLLSSPPNNVNPFPLKFLEDNYPRSFHARFYPHGKSHSATSSRFHLLEDDDVDTTLPWCPSGRGYFF